MSFNKDNIMHYTLMCQDLLTFIINKLCFLEGENFSLVCKRIVYPFIQVD